MFHKLLMVKSISVIRRSLSLQTSICLLLWLTLGLLPLSVTLDMASVCLLPLSLPRIFYLLLVMSLLSLEILRCMCQNKKFIFNRYIGRSLLVSCDKCPACRQKKGNRFASRIRSHKPDGLIPMFVHLTYLNECVPYIRKSELLQHPSYANVYRDYDRIRVRHESKAGFRIKYVPLHEPLDQVSFLDSDGDCNLSYEDIFNAPVLQDTYNPRPTTLDMSDKIGIIYYKDVQNFFKKLKLYLKRDYGFNEVTDYKVTFCSVSEYGGRKYRPHFHLLIWCRRSDWSIFVATVLKSWTFSFRYVTKNRLEPAIDAASYVASYLGKSVDFPKIFEKHSLKQKHSFSQGFGTSLRSFRLSQILEAVRNGKLMYDREVVVDGSPTTASFFYPQYVINRYFPKCKGFGRLPDGAIRWLFNVSLRPSRSTFEKSVSLIVSRLVDIVRNTRVYLFGFDDLRPIAVRLVNKVILCNMTFTQYGEAYTSVWRCYYSTLYRNSLESLSIAQQWQYYDNIADYLSGELPSMSLDELLFNSNIYELPYEVDPNFFIANLSEHCNLVHQFEKRCKQHQVNDDYYSSYNKKII